MIKKNTRPVQISAVIKTVFKDSGLAQAVREKNLRDRWQGLVGNKIAEITEIKSISNGCLYVEVSSPAWKMELNFKKQDILNKLNTTHPEEKIRDLIFI